MAIATAFFVRTQKRLCSNEALPHNRVETNTSGHREYIVQADKLEPISEEELARAMPKRRVGFRVWALVGFLVFVAAPVLTYLSWVTTARHRFEQRLDELAKAGIAVDADDLDAMYVVPDGLVDSTHLYLNAMSVLTSDVFSSDAEDVLQIGSRLESPPFPPDEWDGLADAEKLLAKYDSVLEELHLAARQGGVAAYPLDFEDGFGTLLSHAQNLRMCVRFLLLDAHVHVRGGDMEAATQSLDSSLIAARSLQAEPVIVSQMVYKSLIKRNLEAQMRMVSYGAFSDAQLARLQATLRSFDVRYGMTRGFQGEQAMFLIALRDGDREQLGYAGFEGLRLNEVWLLSKLGSRFDDVLLLSECQQQFLATLDKPWPDAMNEVQRVADETTAATEGTVSERRFQLTRACLKLPYSPAMPFHAAATVEAKLHMMDALLAAKRFHLKHGRLPERLDQLVPEFLEAVPQDPFSPADAIEFLSNQNSVKVSSVGLEGSVASDLANRTDLNIEDTGKIEMAITVE